MSGSIKLNEKMLVIKIYENDKNLEEVFFFCGDGEDNLCKR